MPADPPPVRLRAGTPAVEYELRPELVAVHGPGAAGAGTGAVADVGGARVYRAEAAPPGSPAGPVYALKGGTLGVPTGRVLVRFREGVSAAGRAKDVESAGFRLVEVPEYAPHAAWVEAPGPIASALRGLERLRGLPDVDGVEPQLLMARGFRG